MTNKTDDMPDEIWVGKTKDGEYMAPNPAHCAVDGAIKYTRAVEITDERIKAALGIICSQEAGATGYRMGELCKEEIYILTQTLADYAQMVECIRDLELEYYQVSSGHSELLSGGAYQKHAAIIKKCRGQNG